MVGFCICLFSSCNSLEGLSMKSLHKPQLMVTALQPPGLGAQRCSSGASGLTLHSTLLCVSRAVRLGTSEICRPDTASCPPYYPFHSDLRFCSLLLRINTPQSPFLSPFLPSHLSHFMRATHCLGPCAGREWPGKWQN